LAKRGATGCGSSGGPYERGGTTCRRITDRSQSVILGAMEYFFECPYCAQRISMVLDTSVKGQTYVEDCEVCCHPIEVRYTVEDDEVSHFEARAL
jgi:transcription elongation factor Elf1